jgi:hypothetical protein
MGDTCAYALVSGPFFLDFPAERQATRKRNHANWPLDQPRGANTHQHFSDIQQKKIGHKINPSGGEQITTWFGIGTIICNCDAKNKLNKVHTYLIQNFGTKNLTLAIHEEFRLKINEVKILPPNMYLGRAIFLAHRI